MRFYGLRQAAIASFLVTLVKLNSLSASAQGANATISGSVHDTSGAAVSGATVSASGGSTVRTQTAADGSFSVSVPAGIYQITVSAGGYLNASVADFTAIAGVSSPLSVTLTQPSLSSLRTIGQVTSSSRGSQINTGAAVTNFLSAEAFNNLPNPQVTTVLQHLSDVTIQHLGSEADTTIIVGNLQPYETQVLIDGHPIAIGQYGVFISQYFPSFLVGGVETQSGPGNTTAFANIAVGGTANFLTPAFTQKTTAELTYGYDSYETQSSHFLGTGSVGKLQYVADLGINAINGPYALTSKCIVNPDNGGINSNTATQSFGIIQTCTSADGTFFNKGAVGKLKYNFSPVTSFEADFIGAWGGYYPQGTAWALAQGQQTIEQCLKSQPLECTAPQFSNLIGSTITGYTWYVGSSVYNNQDLFDGEFRTALGTTTLLVRPYLGSIEPEIINGIGEHDYAAFYSPPGAASNPAQLAAFNQLCTNTYNSTTTPAGATVTFPNGQQECVMGEYSAFEQDKLYGTTFSLLHPIGDSLINLTYDFHGQSTFAYIDDPSNISVPFSTNRYSTFSLTSDLRFIPKLGINIGLYNTNWTANGVKPRSDTDPTLVGFTRSVSHFDPHVALTYRLNANTSIRAAYGTSTTFPFLGQVSGLASYQTPDQSLGPPFSAGGIITEKNPNLAPEVSLAYSLGADHRFGNGAVGAIDLTDTIVHNVFETLTTSTINPQTGGLEGIFSPVNVASLHAKVASIKYNFAPANGFGFNLSAGAASIIANGLPPGAYSAGTPGFPVNGVQLCGNGQSGPGIPTCVPYLKGYAQFTYARARNTFIGLGIDYEGKNNSFYQPPFALADLVARRTVAKNVDFQLSVENLFNTNNYGSYLSSPNVGSPVVAATLDKNGAIQQTSYVTARISAPPRTAYLSLRIYFGK